MSLHGLKEAPGNREMKFIHTEDILKMLEFVFKNKYFEFNGKANQQFVGVVIGTICAPQYASIFVDKVKAGFPESQKQPDGLVSLY